MALQAMIKKRLKNYYFSKAQKCFTTGNTDEAFHILKSIIDYHPEALKELFKIDFNASRRNNDVKAYYSEVIRQSASAKEEYVDYLIHLSNGYANKPDLDQSIHIIDEGIALVNDKRLINQKVEIIKRFPKSRNNDKINLLQPLIGWHADAQPLLAQIYLDLSRQEKPLDKKRNWLEKSYSIQDNHDKLFNAKLYKEPFQNTLSELLTLAQGYANIGYFDDAYDVLSMLYCHSTSPEPLSRFCKIKIVEVRSCNSYQKKVSLLEEAVRYSNEISKSFPSAGYNAEEVLSEILLIAQNFIQGIESIYEKFDVLNKAYTFVNAHAKDIASLQKPLSEVKEVLIRLLYEEGIRLEKENNLEEALWGYQYIKEQYGYSIDAETRYYICLLKTGKEISKAGHKQIVSLLKEKPDASTQDLVYRYALYLLKNGNHYKEANKIVERYLPQCYPIRKYCKNEYVKLALSELANFNQRYALINSGRLSLVVAQTLFDSIDTWEEKVAKILPDLKGQFLAQKDILRNYILKKLFETEDYTQTFDLLVGSADEYYKNNALLHNVAVAVYGIAQTGKLTPSNYQLIISTWITAVYQDILFIESLHRASWDDQHTFTLAQSLGRINDDAVLPANVNYSDPIDGAVSIGEVQKNLLTEFKNLLTNTSLYSSNQTVEFEQFYEQEIDAISTLFALQLNKSCFHATPYFSKNHQSILAAIEKSLENEFRYPDVDDEDVLELGLKYGLKTKRYADYQSAKSNCDQLISFIEKLNHSKVSTFCARINKQNYPTLYNQLNLKIRSLFDGHVREGIEFDKIFKIYLTVCQTIGDNNLKFIFSNYVNRTVVSRLNDDHSSYKKSQGLTVLLTIYTLIDNNPQMNNNIQLIMNASMGDIVIGTDSGLIDIIFDSPFFSRFEDGILQEIEKHLQILLVMGKADKIDFLIYKIALKTSPNNKNKVDSIKQKKEELFIDIELSQIIDKVNNKSLSHLNAMVQLQGLYEKKPNHRRLCDNIIIMSEILIQEEIIGCGAKSNQVKKILNQLIAKKSKVLQTSANKLKDDYNSILNQLDYANKILMTSTNNTFGSVSLNDKGLALKEGLSYYQKLSQ